MIVAGVVSVTVIYPSAVNAAKPGRGVLERSVLDGFTIAPTVPDEVIWRAAVIVHAARKLRGDQLLERISGGRAAHASDGNHREHSLAGVAEMLNPTKEVPA